MRKEVREYQYPVLYSGGLPAVIDAKPVKKPWFNRKIQSIKWSDFFEVERNEMVVFRITPHSSVTNNTNRKLWRMLHKMYEIYDRKLARLDRNGYKLTYREKDTIWFDVVFRMVDGERKVEFYTATTATWAKKYRELLENKMKVTIEEATVEDLAVPTANTVVQELRYANHDMFSMRTDHSEQTSPIGSVLSALDDISEEGDFARLSVCNETLDRRMWAKLGDYAHGQLDKGKVPQRARMSAGKAIRTSQGVLAGIMNEANALVNDTFTAISRAFFKGESASQYELKRIEPPENGVVLDAKYRRTTDEKRTQPVWKSHVRVAVHTADNKRGKLRRDLVANTITSAFSEIGGDNELKGVRIFFNGKRTRIINELNTLQLSAQTKADPDVNLVSCDEMAKVALQLPTAVVQQRYEDALAVNRKVETDIPAVFRKQAGGMIIGHSEFKGAEVPIYLPMKNYDELFRSYVFQGSQGMGKDTAIKNFVVEACLNHGIGAIIPDAINEPGARGMADGIRDSLPRDKVIDLDLSDVEYPVPMDLTEVVRKLGKNGANRFAQELIDFFGDVETMGQSRSILRDFAKASGGSIHEIKLLLESESHRVNRIAELRKEGNDRLADSLDKWTTEYKEDGKVARDGQKALDGKASAILYRLDELLGDDTLFNIFAQEPTEALNFEQWIAEGKVVILRIPNRKLGTLATKTLIHWITLKTFMTKLLMDDANKGAFIVFNEPHQYMTPGLERLLQRIVLEGRKWRLGSLYAFHHVGLLPRTFADDLQASGTNWFLFANTHKAVYERLSEELAPTFDVASAMQTQKYHAICLLNFGGRRQAPFLMRGLVPLNERTPQYDNSFLTRRHSRMYGRHWTEVERMIAAKERGA
ncbi:MAG: ATP-binding protein [Bacillota bacterium]